MAVIPLPGLPWDGRLCLAVAGGGSAASLPIVSGARPVLDGAEERRMPFLSDLILRRWRAVRPTLAMNPEAAIVKFWLEHPELGSPLGAEVDLQDDASTPAHAGQSFANQIVLWAPGRGAWRHGDIVPERTP